MSEHGSSPRVIVIALLANLGIALAKLIGAYVSQSASLLAESIHSLADCMNQIFLLIGNKASRKPPTKEHPLGFGREAFFWSFMVAIMLFSMGGMFAIYEGYHKINQINEVQAPWIALGILIVSLGLEGYSFWACLKEVRKQNNFGSLWSWIRNSTASDILVIFLEDSAALIGLILATFFLGLAWFTHNSYWDSLGSIVIGFMLLIVAVILGRETKSLLIGEAPTGNLQLAFEKLLAVEFKEARMLKFIALQVGPQEVLTSCKIHPGTMTDLGKAIEMINSIEKKFKILYPQIRWQFVEFDYHD